MELKKHCLYCGKVFTAKRTTTKYCSHICNSRHYKQLKREEKIKLVEKTDFSNMSGSSKIKKHTVVLNNSKQYFCTIEACEFLNISRSTLWRLMKGKHIVFIKIGNRTLFDKNDLKKYLKKLKSETVPIINNNFRRHLYYSIGEIVAMFGISDKALYLLLERNNIKKISQPPYVYVSKNDINAIFGTNNK